MENASERKDRLEANLDVLKRIEKILDEYEPTRELSISKALAQLFTECNAMPTELVEGMIEENLAEFAELDEVELLSVGAGRLEYFAFLRDVQDAIRATKARGIDSFESYAIITSMAANDSESVTRSSLGAISNDSLERVLGGVGVDFMIQVDEALPSDEDKMRVIIGAIVKAKGGSKWRHHQAKKKLKSILERRKGHPEGAGDSGFAMIEGKSLKEVQEKFNAFLQDRMEGDDDK